MDLDKYETQAWRQCGMIREQILKLGIDRVVDRCRSLGTEAVEAYRSENASAYSEYLTSPPARRKTLLRNVPEQQRPEFLICVFFEARCGLALLQAVCRYGVTAGPSYTMILSQAAAAAQLVHDEWPTLWPFDGDNDPFGEN